MSRRSRKPRPKLSAPKRFAPKAGPFDVYVREFVSARTGREERYRNIGEHPLTLAHARGKIGDEQFAAGEELRWLHELCALSGQDSSLMTPGAGGAGAHLPITDAQAQARAVAFAPQAPRLDHRRKILRRRLVHGRGGPRGDTLPSERRSLSCTGSTRRARHCLRRPDCEIGVTNDNRPQDFLIVNG